MKSRIRALNPIKIENRLVPKGEVESYSTNGTQQRQSSQPITSRKIQIVERTIGQRPISPILVKRNTEPDRSDTIRVTIHRSNSIRSESSRSESSDKISSSNGSDLEFSPSYAEPQNDILKTPNKRLLAGDSQTSLPLKTVTESISSEYYHQIDNRINKGIKKLQEMDKRLDAYDNRQTDTPKPFQIKQKQLTNIKESVQLKQTISAMNRKKQEYLQQILTKTRKIKQLQGLASERERKLVQLEGQIKLFNIKVNRLQENAKKHTQDTERYKQNMAQLIFQINSLKKQMEQNKLQNDQQKNILTLKFQQKTKQINIRNSQYMNTIKANFEEKQAKMLKQVLDQKQTNDKIINELRIQKQTQVIKIKQHYQESLLKIKAENEKNIQNLTQNWALQKNSLINQNKTQLSLQQQQYRNTISQLHRKINQYVQQIKEIRKILEQKISETTAKIQQGSSNELKIQQYYKSQYKKLQSKYKDQTTNKTQLQSEILSLTQQIQMTKIQMRAQKVIIETLAGQLDKKKLIYEAECKKVKNSSQAYIQQNALLKQQLNRLKISNRNLQQKNAILKEEISKFQTQTNNVNSLLAKIRQLQQQNTQYIDKAIILTNRLNLTEEKQQILSIKMSQIQQKLIISNNLITTLKQKHIEEVKNIKDQFDTKSKQIFQKLTDYYQEKVRLNQQISTYKSKIQQKQQELNQQGYKMHEIQNLMKNKEKQVLINMVEYEKLNKQLTNYENNTKQLEEVAKKYLGQFVKTNKQIGLNMLKNQTQGKDDLIVVEDLKGNNLITQVFKTIFAQNKKIVEGYQVLEKQNKKFKTNIPEKDITKIAEKLQPKIQRLIKTFNDISASTQNNYQDKNIQTLIKQFCDNLCQTQNEPNLNKKSIFSEILNIKIQSTTQISPKLVITQNQPKQSKNIETMTDEQYQPKKYLIKTNYDQQCQIGYEQAQMQINHQGLLSQLNILRDQVSQKQNIIEVMQSCIEDYKQMVTQLKDKLQIQQSRQIRQATTIDMYYNQILDFFEIDPQKTDQDAHQELIQLITVMMAKLEKTVQSVKQLQTQLLKVNDQNLSLKQKKRKIVRQIKKYQQMTDRVCSQNQQLKLKMFQMGDRIDRDHQYIKQLLKLINDNNQENIRSNFTLLNFRLLKYKMIDDQQDQQTQQSKLFQESRDQNTLSYKQDKTQYQWSQTRIENNFDQDTASLSQIFSKKSRILNQDKEIKKFQLVEQKQNEILEEDINQLLNTQKEVKQSQNLENFENTGKNEEIKENEAINELQIPTTQLQVAKD